MFAPNLDIKSIPQQIANIKNAMYWCMLIFWH